MSSTSTSKFQPQIELDRSLQPATREVKRRTLQSQPDALYPPGRDVVLSRVDRSASPVSFLPSSHPRETGGSAAREIIIRQAGQQGQSTEYKAELKCLYSLLISMTILDLCITHIHDGCLSPINSDCPRSFL